MEALPPTGYVILGMLGSGKARTGYDIKQLTDVSTRFFWAASYGQIYPELKRLEDAGLVEGEDDSTGGRKRRSFQLTDAGRGVLHDWLTSGEPLHFELRHEGMLRYFFADGLAPAEQLELVSAIRAEHERVHDELAAIHAMAAEMSDESGLHQPVRTAAFGIRYQRFVADWAAEEEARLRAEIDDGEGST